MDPIIVRVDERLANVGDTYTIEGHLDQTTYSLGEHDFSLPKGISYNVVLTNAGEGILATGMLFAHVEGSCDRCLDEADFDISGEVDEYYLFEEPEEQVVSDEDDDEDSYALVVDDTIDLAPALNMALIMETPFVVLCKPDCKGLCPTCGANLNEETCDCAERRAQEQREWDSESNPFAALKDLHLDE